MNKNKKNLQYVFSSEKSFEYALSGLCQCEWLALMVKGTFLVTLKDLIQCYFNLAAKRTANSNSSNAKIKKTTNTIFPLLGGIRLDFSGPHPCMEVNGKGWPSTYSKFVSLWYHSYAHKALCSPHLVVFARREVFLVESVEHSHLCT